MTENEQQPIISPEDEASDEEFRAAVDAALEAATVVEETAAPATAGENVSALDSLQGNEFAVELDGEPVKGVFRVSGLVSFRLHVGDNAPTVTLAKMVQRDASLPFNKWLRESIESGSRPTRNVAIVAIDDGEETRRWTLTDAYITEVSYSDFDTSSSEFVEEVVTIAYAKLIEAWTWSDK